MSQRKKPHGSSPTDNLHSGNSHVRNLNGNSNNHTARNPGKPPRPYSTSSTVHTNNNTDPSFLTSGQPPLHPSAASISSSNTSSTRKAATRPTNTMSSGARPKTTYQAVTWKENLDAFNRRLRRGSLSLDAAAQEDELLATQAQAHQQQSQGLYLDQDVYVHEDVIEGQDEHAQLLGNLDNSKFYQGHKGIANYGTAVSRSGHAQVQLTEDHHHHPHDHRRDRVESTEPAFPVSLNPAMATVKSSKLGVFSGVFVPCVLSIWGIILFLRFGFIIGQAGVMGTMAMFVVGYAINIFTTLSLSAISTNGTVRGGGVYYLLSRSLGPEFGGSIGLIFFLCTVIGCGMNVLGFVEPLIANFGETSGTVYRVLPEGELWDFIYGTILLVSCTLVCLVGSKLFSRASLVLAVIILLSTLSIFVSFALVPPFTHPERNIEYTGFSWETLQENMWPRFTTTNGPDGAQQSFQTVFGVLFPACIGILAGASMSGDLEDPSKSIPKGTLWAVGSTFCVYTFIVVLMGGSISRSTMYTDLSVLQDISISPLFIASGALAASVFATLGSVIGAAKILQAIARDNLLPLLSVFGQGTPKTDEPTLAVLLTYILCQFCVFLTDMNMIATFVSMITLLTFLILNLACFLLKIGSAPNFRPSFRFFHWWTAFAGMVVCAVVMAFVDLGKSLLSGLMTAVLFIWIHYWSPPKRWGDVTQSLIYHQVRKYLLRLDSRKEHVKFWRPQILLLVHHPRSEYHLIQFCNHLKKGALYVLGHVILGDLRDVLQEYRRQQGSWLKFVDVLHIKAFVNLSVADSVRSGARNLLMGTGLGGMRPNIVVMGAFNLDRYFKEKQGLQQQQQQQQQQQELRHHNRESPIPLRQDTFSSGGAHMQPHTSLDIPVSLPIDNIRVETPIKITEYVSIIEDVLLLNKAVAIGCGFDRLELPEEHKNIWKQLFSFESLRNSGVGTPLSPFLPMSSSRPSSLRRHHNEDTRKKKYIDLWPMQMSVTPLQYDDVSIQQPHKPNHKRASKDLSSGSPMAAVAGEGGTFSEQGPSRTVEANLTNFDTYTMVLQMGCILHMVPQWKENFVLRVMVFVEYKEDVEEEKKRLKALLENLRIPAEVKVMCLDGGDSDTYHRLVNGIGGVVDSDADASLDEYPVERGFPSSPLAALGSDIIAVNQSGAENENGHLVPVAPIALRAVPRNINPFWQQEHATVEEEGEEDKGDRDEEDTDRKLHTDGQDSSHETGPYSEVAAVGHGHLDRSRNMSSSPSGLSSRAQHQQQQQHRQQNYSVFQASAPPPQRRRTISHTDHFQQPLSLRRQSPNAALRINTSLSPRLWQRSPIAVASAHPSSSQHRHYASGSGSGGGGGIRYRSTMMAGSTSPMIDSHLGTSAPLGASMNFRIAVPLPKRYLDPKGLGSSGSESDSMSSEDDEACDYNDDDLVYGGGGSGNLHQHPIQQLVRHSSVKYPLYLKTDQDQSQQQQQQLPSQPSHQVSSSTPARTSLGSETSGLGAILRDSTTIEESTPGQVYPHQRHPHYPHHQQQPHPYPPEHLPQPLPPMSTSPLVGSITKNPWASVTTASLDMNHPEEHNSINTNDFSSGTKNGLPAWNDWSNGNNRALDQQQQQQQQDVLLHHSPSPQPDDNPSEQAMFLSPREDGLPGPGVVPVPLQFDHLAPEAQLMILNELMRIHSSAETTSIIFTTMPAPEEGTCLKEESSLAYLEQLDLLMEGIDIPVLLIHAKSLTVTMTL